MLKTSEKQEFPTGGYSPRLSPDARLKW